MAFIKPEEFSASGFPFIPRFGSSTSLYQHHHHHHQDKLIPSPISSSSLPLPSMSTFSLSPSSTSPSSFSPQSSPNKRRHHSENISYDLPLPPLKVPKLIPTGDAATVPPPPPLVQLSRGGNAGGAHHQCTSEDCHYCSGLTNLDIAAFYWSMIAMRGYSKAKTSSVSSTGSSHSAYDTLPFAPKLLPPSPTASQSNTFDLMTSYNKPPSPSGSLSSMDSEPLSPSCSSTTSESSSTKDLGNNGVKYQCNVCHKSYSHPRLLNRHLQSHTPYKKHHCPRCRKGFNDAFDLKRHIRTHTGIKPFHCELCEKSFTQVSCNNFFIHFSLSFIFTLYSSFFSVYTFYSYENKVRTDPNNF